MAKPSISMSDTMLENVHERLSGHTDRSKWIQTAIAMRLEIERAAENAGVDTDDLDDDWWRDWLYDGTREHLRERREREAAEREELEAD